MSRQLEVEDLHIAYGTDEGALEVVRGISFALPRGAIGCLLGPSGCGKTTVLRCIAGFEPAKAGRILLNGKVVSSPTASVPPEKRRVGMVFQDYALFPHLTARGNIGFGFTRETSERENRVAELAALTGITELLDKYPHELSGGQQQRVALARALAPRPELLLLDEPFSSLDTDLRERLSLELREIIKASGATSVLVTHDQQEAFAIADEIGVLHEGRIEQWDSAYNLYHRPESRFIADFVGQGVLLPARVLAGGELEFELGILENRGQSQISAKSPGGDFAKIAPGQLAAKSPGGDFAKIAPGQLAAKSPGGDFAKIAPGRFVGKSDSDPDFRREVEVLLRPDDVVHDDASAMQAEVVHKAFRGAEILYTLRLESGRKVLALVPSHHNHALGERIGIRLDVDHVIAFAPTP